MDANKAWENALILAKELKCQIKVCFRWRHDDKAAYADPSGRVYIPAQASWGKIYEESGTGHDEGTNVHLLA